MKFRNLSFNVLKIKIETHTELKNFQKCFCGVWVILQPKLNLNVCKYFWLDLGDSLLSSLEVIKIDYLDLVRYKGIHLNI